MTNYIAKGKHSKGFEFTTTEHFSPSAAENLRNGGRSSSGIIYKREEKYFSLKKPFKVRESNRFSMENAAYFSSTHGFKFSTNEWLHENKSNTSGFDCEWQVFPKQ
ncbi:unnamed protein product [Rhizophagus irregularis]|uniref:Uncharacterized protein n=1 Tax=Rhizophagus irregularis TaxID=588596 RepID=A0A916E5F8_9GLOM|nr:unnamed protein product [Rhizophagus irregularis]CAB5360615.1 unnamed protein product [Rhizophagus irregularis]